MDGLQDLVTAIAQLAADANVQAIFAGNIDEGALDNGVKFLDAQYLFFAEEKVGGKLFRERKRRRDAQDIRPGFPLKGIQRIHETDAMGRDGLAGKGTLSRRTVLPFCRCAAARKDPVARVA